MAAALSGLLPSHCITLLLPWLPQGEETHHVAVIMSNPEQSKHLETARMKARRGWAGLQGAWGACGWCLASVPRACRPAVRLLALLAETHRCAFVCCLVCRCAASGSTWSTCAARSTRTTHASQL